jgi:hypothetical protein
MDSLRLRFFYFFREFTIFGNMSWFTASVTFACIGG